MAVCCACSPDVFLGMRESQLFLFSRLIREAHRHVKSEEGLQIARCFTDPGPVFDAVYGEVQEDEPSAGTDVVAWAESIRRLPDSGSHSSERRMARRRRKKR